MISNVMLSVSGRFSHGVLFNQIERARESSGHFVIGVDPLIVSSSPSWPKCSVYARVVRCDARVVRCDARVVRCGPDSLSGRV